MTILELVRAISAKVGVIPRLSQRDVFVMDADGGLHPVERTWVLSRDDREKVSSHTDDGEELVMPGSLIIELKQPSPLYGMNPDRYGGQLDA